MDDLQFFTDDPRLHRVPCSVALEVFDNDSDKRQGLIADLDVKNALVSVHGSEVKIPHDGATFDAQRTSTGKTADIKLVRKIIESDYNGFAAFVYMSHREYLFAKENNTLFILYGYENGCFVLMATVDFVTAKELDLIKLYPRGTWVHCEQTGKDEPPWSVDVLPILTQSTIDL